MRRDDDDMPDGHVLDDDDRALIAKLRALPGEGEEPDWRAFEAQIRAQVAPLSTPSPWWRTWRWLIPIGALATTAAIVVVLASRPHATGDVATTEQAARHDASVAAEPDPARAATHEDEGATAPTMWIAGEVVELDEISDEALELDPLLDALDPAGITGEPGTEAAPETDSGTDHETETIGGMLPASDDRWIDSLDDDAAERLEQFLARKRS